METTECTAVVRVFTDPQQAKQAVEELQRANFATEEIVFVVRSDMFITSGILPEDTVYCHYALEAGYIIMAVQAGERVALVERILHDNGASNVRQTIHTLHKNYLPTYSDDHGLQGAYVPYGTHR